MWNLLCLVIVQNTPKCFNKNGEVHNIIFFLGDNDIPYFGRNEMLLTECKIFWERTCSTVTKSFWSHCAKTQVQSDELFKYGRGEEYSGNVEKWSLDNRGEN